MKSNTCIICGVRFKPRRGKNFCSQKCKQKAYNNRKANIETEKLDKLKPLPTSDSNYGRKFNFKENEWLDYDKWLKENKKECLIINDYNDGLDQFKDYCYLRQNLLGEPDFEQIHKYLNNLGNEAWYDDYFTNEGSQGRARSNFHKKLDPYNVEFLPEEPESPAEQI